MSIDRAEYHRLIDREDPNNIDAILSVPNPYKEEVIRTVKDNCEALFTWDYTKGERPALDKLYEKAKHSQWNASTDLDWSIEVDHEKLVTTQWGYQKPPWDLMGIDVKGTPMAKWGPDEWIQFNMEQDRWTMSQFMHGEQGALLCTAKIVETVPWIDAKYYASTQVMDEARHVEVFSRYLDEKWGGHYPLNVHLGMLLEDIIEDSRWDITYLGMQIMVEGLALAAFGLMHNLTQEPLLKKLLRYVMSDEARHVAFGVLSLKEYYEGLSDKEMRERQEFAFEAALRMRDRLLGQDIWDRMGVDPKVGVNTMKTTEMEDPFQLMLFAKIVPNCKKLGLLDASGGWLRERFQEIGVIQFEDWVDTGEEYELLDEVAKDRAETAAAS